MVSLFQARNSGQVALSSLLNRFASSSMRYNKFPSFRDTHSIPPSRSRARRSSRELISPILSSDGGLPNHPSLREVVSTSPWICWLITGILQRGCSPKSIGEMRLLHTCFVSNLTIFPRGVEQVSLFQDGFEPAEEDLAKPMSCQTSEPHGHGLPPESVAGIRSAYHAASHRTTRDATARFRHQCTVPIFPARPPDFCPAWSVHLKDHTMYE